MPFLDASPPIAFAHRGFATDGCENSMSAFGRAIALGYQYVETDVRVTSDGVALAFHDASLDRVTDRRGRVADQPWNSVRLARIRGKEPIPLLADVLGTWPDVRVNIDVKSDAGVGPVLDVIARTRSADRVCVGAFSGRRVDEVRGRMPTVCTSLGPREIFALRVAAARGRRARAVSVQSAPPLMCAQVPVRAGPLRLVDERFLGAAHSLGLPVHVWTVNDRSEMSRLLDLGVDGLITDAADVLRELLIERGQWPATVS